MALGEKVAKIFPWHIEVPFRDGDVYYRIRAHDSLMTIAQKYLGDGHDWWIILAANKDKNYNTPWDAVAGDIIRIPHTTDGYLDSVQNYYNREDSQ